MLKRVSVILIIGIFIFGMNISFAMMCGSEGEHSSQKYSEQAHTEHEHGVTETSKEPVSAEAINVGNKICPVSGEKIEEKTKTTYEYEGKIYNFCCASCIDKFKKDSGKYIKKVEQELQAESQEQADQKEYEMGMTQGSETKPQGIHQGHHH